MHICKYLPLFSYVLCYIMRLIVVSVCTIVNLLTKPCAAIWQRVYYCAKLRMLCYVHLTSDALCSITRVKPIARLSFAEFCVQL